MARTVEPTALDTSGVGAELRDARLAIGATIEDMSEHLRISRRYLSALEEGRTRDLPGPTYALGFVRSYAQSLGLDAEELTRRFRDGAGAAAKQRTDLVFPEPVPKRGVPAGAVILIGAVLAIGSYVAWWQWSGSGDRSLDRVEAPPRRLEEAAGTTPRPAAPVLPPTLGQVVPASPPAAGGGQGHAPGTPSAQAPNPAPGQQGPAASVAPSPNRPAAPVPGAPLPGQGTAPSATPGPVAQQAQPVAPRPAVPQSPAPGTQPPQAATAPATGEAPAAPVPPPLAAPVTPSAPNQADGQGRIVLRAVPGPGEGSWVQIRAKGASRPLLSRLLRPGETYTVPAGEGMTLTTGKADALEIVVDGQASPFLAGRTNVVRDIPLDPDRLRNPAPAGG
jgi:cytoskeleton protein RodZ